MTERSLLWTDSSGDGGPYSPDQLRLPFRAFAGAHEPDDGVFKDHLREYAASIAGVGVRVASGRGLCDGTVHENNAYVDLVASVPRIGATGGVVVLQKDWDARTVRVALHQNNDGIPSPPAPTQVAGGRWEVPLWDYEVTTTGMVTITTDRRCYVRPVDHEHLLRSFYEGGAYALHRLGSATATAPVNGSLVGMGWQAWYSTGAYAVTSDAVCRGDWRMHTGAPTGNWCMFRGPSPVRANQDWVGIFSITPTPASGQYVQACLGNASGIGNLNDEVGFRSVDGGNITAYADSGGTESTLDSGVLPSASVNHVLVMALSPKELSSEFLVEMVADFWVDGVPLGRITSNLPTVDLTGKVGVANTTGTDQSLFVGEAILFARAS